ncbi:MAG: hypothetical protein ACYC3A_02180 [Halothiobacillus sp.]
MHWPRSIPLINHTEPQEYILGLLAADADAAFESAQAIIGSKPQGPVVLIGNWRALPAAT